MPDDYDLNPVDYQPRFTEPFAVPTEPATPEQTARMREGVKSLFLNTVGAPGVAVQPIAPETPGMLSDVDVAKQIATDEHLKNWAPQQALNMVGQGAPMAVEGAAGMTGGKLRSIKEMSDSWGEQGVRNFIADRPQRGQYQLSDLVVPKEQRGQGVGSAFMKELTDIADAEGKTVTLTATKDYGATSLDRLKGFYKQFGFVENKGRNKDFSISDNMYRPPQAGHFATKQVDYDPFKDDAKHAKGGAVKLSHASVGYVASSTHLPQKCGGCTMFIPPAGCTLVQSPIKAGGWCRRFVKEKHAPSE